MTGKGSCTVYIVTMCSPASVLTTQLVQAIWTAHQPARQTHRNMEQKQRTSLTGTQRNSMPLPVLLQKIYLKPIERNTPAPDRTLLIRVMSHAEGATLNFPISQKKMALKAIFFSSRFFNVLSQFHKKGIDLSHY